MSERPLRIQVVSDIHVDVTPGANFHDDASIARTAGSENRDASAATEAMEAQAEEEEERRLMHTAENLFAKLIHQGRMFEAMRRREAAEDRVRLVDGTTGREGDHANG